MSAQEKIPKEELAWRVFCGRLFMSWLPLGLLPVAYFGGIILNNYHLFSGGFWRALVRVSPPFDQFYQFELEKNGAKSADRLISMSATFIVVLAAYFFANLAFIIWRVTSDHRSGFAAKHKLSQFPFFTFLFGGMALGAIFYFKMPTDHRVPGPEVWILATDGKFPFYYGVALLFIWLIVGVLGRAARYLMRD